jgi:hypothetical protein
MRQLFGASEGLLRVNAVSAHSPKQLASAQA